MGTKKTRKWFNVDTGVLVPLLADGLTITAVAERLQIPYTTAWRYCDEAEVKEGVEQELAHREGVARHHRLVHAPKVFERAAGAAMGEWVPTETQLELMRYFMGWEKPVGSEVAAIPEAEGSRTLIVQQFYGREDGAKQAD